MRAGARQWSDSIDSQTTERERGWGGSAGGGGGGGGGRDKRRDKATFYVLSHETSKEYMCDRNCRPRRHGGLFLCLRQIFISPI